jgi:predicted KAP-like P-loop ATPase
MWNDNETDQDLIDFKYLVQSINSIIQNDDLAPSTIGIYGDWGSGKSSLMKMIEQDNTTKGNIVIKFNGWLFEGYEDSKIALLTTLIDELIKSRKWNEKAKKYISRLVKKIKWLKVIGKAGKIGLDAYMASNGTYDYNNALNDISSLDIDNYIKEVQDENKELIEKGIREFHKDFGKLIAQTNADRVIVLIDDLDRCNPDTVISTLEAIKLFLFAEKTIFIVSADERLINYAVKKRFPELPSHDYDVSKDYLEKLIQFPIRIPSLNESEFETYINLLFAKVNLDNNSFNDLLDVIFDPKKGNTEIGVSKINSDSLDQFLPNASENLKQDYLLSKQINSVLVSILKGNPRQCKRFLNMLMLRISMAESKGISLKKGVLAKLMLLEHFKTDSFNKLVKSSYENDFDVVLKLEQKEVDDSIKEFQGWLQDSWLLRWIDLEPKIGEENLKEYFYFTRNSQKSEFTLNKRLSSEAKEILISMFSSASEQKKAIKESKALAESDILTIFREICDKIIVEEDTKKRGNLFTLLLKYSMAHNTLVSEYCAFIEKVPENILLPSNPPNLLQITKGGPFEEQAKFILDKWSKSTNITLSKIAAKKQK